MFLLHIWGFSCLTHYLQKDAFKGGLQGGGSGGVGCDRGKFKSVKAYRCVQHWGGGGGACNGLWVHTQFEYLSSAFFLLGNMQILKTFRVKIYTNRYQELYCYSIRLQVFTTLYQINSRLWESLNFIQTQTMAVLVLNFIFVLDFDNSRIGVQFSNKLTLCKLNIVLQTILSLRLCIAPDHD